MRRSANAAERQDKRARVCVLGRLRVNNLRILDMQAGLSSDGNGINLKLPLALDTSVVL